MGELIVLGKNCHHHYIPVLLYCLRNYTICRVCFIQLKLKSRFSSSQKKKKKKNATTSYFGIFSIAFGVCVKVCIIGCM